MKDAIPQRKHGSGKPFVSMMHPQYSTSMKRAPDLAPAANRREITVSLAKERDVHRIVE
jgi:hypothetical protein